MLKVTRVIPAREVDGRRIIDAVILDHERRRGCRGALTGVKGTPFVVELTEPVTVRGGDAFLIGGDDLVEVVAQAEHLLEIRAADVTALARIALALGDRHVPIQILPNRIRLQPDGSLEELLAALGARVVAIEAPFDPEGGAYLAGAEGDHDRGRHNDAHGHSGHDHHHGGHAHRARGAGSD